MSVKRAADRGLQQQLGCLQLAALAGHGGRGCHQALQGQLSPAVHCPPPSPLLLLLAAAAASAQVRLPSAALLLLPLPPPLREDACSSSGLGSSVPPPAQHLISRGPRRCCPRCRCPRCQLADSSLPQRRRLGRMSHTAGVGASGAHHSCIGGGT